jgi:D-inositol-3-phosphate glycosyltransferase
MTRLLMATLYVPGSGLTNVFSALAQRLRNRFCITGLGFRPNRTRCATETMVEGCPVHVQASAAPVFCVDPAWLQDHMRTTDPQAILVAGPVLLVTPLLRQLQPYRRQCRMLLYLPIEGQLTDEDIAQPLELVDVCILYTWQARDEAAAMCARIAQRRPGFQAPRLGVAGHGVDTRHFFPLADRIAVRHRLFPDRPELHDAFLVLNANRPYHRKRLDLTIKGFGRFARDRPDAWLYLHVGRMPVAEEARLRGLIAECGAGERVLLNHLNPSGDKLDIEHLNLLYNASDVGLTTAMGEGWGLGTFEHAATGAAQIVPDHTSFRENWQGAAELLPPVGREHIFYELTDMFVISPEDVAAALARLHNDVPYRQGMARAAYARATDPRYSWDTVAKIFQSLIDQALMAQAV